MATARKNIESILLDRSWVSPQDLDKARLHKKPGQDLGQVLVEMGALEPHRLTRIRAQEYGLRVQMQIDDQSVDPRLLARVPINYAKKNRILPLFADGTSVTVAVAEPANYEALDDLRMLFGTAITPVVAPAEVIAEATNRAYDHASAASAQDVMLNLEEHRLDQVASELAQEPRDLLETEDAAPIIRLVNSLLSQAVKDRASDIHVEPFESDVVVRFRVDGMLYDVVSIPRRFQPALSSRIKVMAGLNIAEKRLPQDGRIRFRIAGRDIDVRVSTIPTSFGERIVLRLLDPAQALVDLSLDKLGFTEGNLARMERLVRQSHGIILLTGPTGSGKTTTLYSCLNRINAPERNIITIEDPVEYQLRGIGQMQVNHKIDLTFASGLRSILRQDPDVIMVGEIRDQETAEIAIQAALTGHLVFSTLHTNDSFGALTRLVEMGIEPFLVSSSVLALIAQRLVRVLCRDCREPYTPSREELARAGLRPEQLNGPLYRAPKSPCRACRATGYRGRTAILELMLMTDEVRRLVMARADAAGIRQACTAQGMKLLRDDGAARVLAGQTTIEELLRVTQEEIA